MDGSDETRSGRVSRIDDERSAKDETSEAERP